MSNMLSRYRLIVIIEKFGEEFLAKLKEARFRCVICLDEVAVDASITNDCDHRMCVDCFVGYTENLINNRQCNPHQMICPFEN